MEEILRGSQSIRKESRKKRRNGPVPYDTEKNLSSDTLIRTINASYICSLKFPWLADGGSQLLFCFGNDLEFSS